MNQFEGVYVLTKYDEKNNECFCKLCGHNKANQCIELGCNCCLEADKIRYEHLVPEKSYEEIQNEKFEEQKEELAAWNRVPNG
jgi:hypothetical protein